MAPLIFMQSKFSLTWYSDNVFTDAILQKTQLLICVGLVSIYIGFYNTLSRYIARLMPQFVFDWPIAHVNEEVAVCLTLTGCSAAYMAFRQLHFGGEAIVNEGAQSFVNAIITLAGVGLCMLFALRLQAD